MTLTDEQLNVSIVSQDGSRDLSVVAYLDDPTLPEHSPFQGTNDARRYVGPLPWTLDYESQTHSIIAVRGHRIEWKPKPVKVEVHQISFFDQQQFAGVDLQLANAFYVSEIPYRWDRGVVLAAGVADQSWQLDEATDD